MKIADNVYRINTCYPTLENIPLAGYLVVGSDRTALIDATIPRAIEENVAPFMARLGLSVADIDLVIVTHGHPDHVGGLAELRKVRPDLEIISGEADRAWVEDHARMFAEVFERFPGTLDWPDEVRDYIVDELAGDDTPVSRCATVGERIDLGDTSLEILDASGHSPGHIAILDERSAALFTGDAVQGRGISHVNSAKALPPLYENVADYLATQARLADTGAQYLLSTHHEIKEGPDVARFLDLSATFVHRNGRLVQEFCTQQQGVISLGDVASELARQTNALEAEDYAGPLQFHLDAQGHLDQLTSEGFLSVAAGGWTRA